MSQIGTVYLLHLSSRLPGGGQHYIGWAESLYPRLSRHLKGAGAKMMACAKRHGIGWELVRCWEEVTRAVERRLKRRHQHARLCPTCRRHALRLHRERERRTRARVRNGVSA